MTVMFTSGTTGDPKGAVLTDGNIASNVRGVDEVIHLRLARRADRHPALLPLLRLYDYALDRADARCQGARTTSIRSKRRLVGKLMSRAQGHRSSSRPRCSCAPTCRRCDPEDFSALEVLVTGGERLPKQVADEFEAQFRHPPDRGIRRAPKRRR